MDGAGLKMAEAGLGTGNFVNFESPDFEILPISGKRAGFSQGITAAERPFSPSCGLQPQRRIFPIIRRWNDETTLHL